MIPESENLPMYQEMPESIHIYGFQVEQGTCPWRSIARGFLFPGVESEEDIFRLLGLPYLEPEKRI